MIDNQSDIGFNIFRSFNTKTIFWAKFTFKNGSLESTVKFPYLTTFFYITNKLALFSTIFSRGLPLTSYLLMYTFNFSIIHQVQSTFIRFLMHNFDFFKKRVSLLWLFNFIGIVAKSMKKSNYSTFIITCLF
jgi:hypothetical protein